MRLSSETTLQGDEILADLRHRGDGGDILGDLTTADLGSDVLPVEKHLGGIRIVVDGQRQIAGGRDDGLRVGGVDARAEHRVATRYMAPVSTYLASRRLANARQVVDLPVPEGPSTARMRPPSGMFEKVTAAPP